MYGDSTVIRALARRLREQGAAIRAEADSLTRHANAVEWTGLAGDAMRVLVRDHGADLRACAALHADAADALDRHAREVDRVKELIASIEQQALGALDSVRHAVGDLTHTVSNAVPGPLEHWAHRFVPPPQGSKDWLAVHLPSVP
jgi:NAD(P)-dependent dehydrogenase (short-subunit alcohol dehydrogenase family)